MELELQNTRESLKTISQNLWDFDVARRLLLDHRVVDFIPKLSDARVYLTCELYREIFSELDEVALEARIGRLEVGWLAFVDQATVNSRRFSEWKSENSASVDGLNANSYPFVTKSVKNLTNFDRNKASTECLSKSTGKSIGDLIK